MSESARILATESMAEARAALAEYAESVERILAGVDADIQRVTQWLQQDRPAHWKHQVRAREDDVLKAKALIARKELTTAPGPADTVVERKALDRAKRRLDDARLRQEATRRWAPVFEREAMAYKGAAQQLRAMVSGQIPVGLARISRMMESVEQYLSIAPPTGDPDAPPPQVADPPADETGEPP